MSSIRVIGAGISGLATACYLAKEGHQVHIHEKNSTVGGRARYFEAAGYRFDMGPSWYWMPDVFERFFNHFDKEVSDFYQLTHLDPGFRMFFGPHDHLDVPAHFHDLQLVCEALETGAGEQLQNFLKDAHYKYQVGMQDLVYKPGLSLLEFANWRMIKGLLNLNLMTPFDKFVRKYFKHPRLQQLMEFPILFLGAAPAKTPALYSLMNYAGLVQGTYYPMGGMNKVMEAMTSLALELGVEIDTDAEVTSIKISGGNATEISINGLTFSSDFFVSSADYHHTDQVLLPRGARNYSESYWQNRVMAPSSLLFYLGINRKVDGLLHHNLFFDESLDVHAHEIYTDPQWPSAPLFYVCCPSKTDASVAPDGHENIFLLMPLAAGLHDTHEHRQKYFDLMITRLESTIGQSFRENITYRQSYCLEDFVRDYHAHKGNAYGLANTLRQTAILKPRIRSRHARNLFHTGHLTVPGPGVPPSLISGKIVADQIISQIKSN